MDTTTTRAPGRPKVAAPRKQLPLLQARMTADTKQFLKDAAWARRQHLGQFVIDAAVRAAARILHRKAPRH